MEYKTGSRLIYLAAGLFIAIWFLQQVMGVILLVFFAVVITIVLNAPVTWLQEKEKFSRSLASLIVFFGVLAVFALIAWMVIPKIVTQVKLLIDQLPDYLDRLDERVTHWIGEHGAKNGESPKTVTPVADQLPPLIKRVGQ